MRLIQTALLVAIVVLLFQIASRSAQAADPECANLQSSATIIDSSDGTICYCTPQVGETGVLYPVNGPPMSCFILEAGTIIDQKDGLAPGAKVCGVFAAYRFGHEVSAYCQNSAGDGEESAVAQAGFPDDKPGTVLLLPGN